ncbi:MAG: ABC transporter permease [Thermoflexales bacterium]|nr:ABC transporter permease [Thermoflexales bacterium]
MRERVSAQPLLRKGANLALAADPTRALLRRFIRNRSAFVGSVLFGLIVLLALIGTRATPYDPVQMDIQNRLAEPGLEHVLGSDHYGRDIFSRLLAGAHLSLLIGLVSVSLAVSSGLLLGLPAGYFGGWVDMLVMRVMDLMLSFPSVLLALGIVAIAGPSLFNVMLAVGIASVPSYTRLVRASVLGIRGLPYIEAARALGSAPLRIITQHVIPNILAPLIVLATLGTAGAILTGAALSFLGLGSQPPIPEWGAMLSEARNYMRLGWWLTVFPGLAIAITVLSLNQLGDGLRDLLDPYMRNSP